MTRAELLENAVESREWVEKCNAAVDVAENARLTALTHLKALGKMIRDEFRCCTLVWRGKVYSLTPDDTLREITHVKVEG